ncbi:hypothetical protein K402DRAFT_390500 [Aulographum hederae CBS 113979]|uniref:DM2 domain-containing protein n=1 Tax=Aulographum hederae CBS 113979 TaxID=1176131 RepID=A0A6G1H8Z7_9PEZI|nr:hypothetical protein K402DRAFT_390500 [Aulographum hederae CBS 113979]
MNQYARQFPQPGAAQRSPHAPRRGPGPMVPAPQQGPTPQQIMQQQQLERQKHDAARRQARKPMDKNIPDGVEDIILGDGVERYRRLREAERKLDAVMLRKKLDLQDSIARTIPRHGTLRIWISNTVENQPWQRTDLTSENFDFDNSQATFKVKIEGRLLDDPEADEEDEERTDKEKVVAEKDPNAMDEDADEPPKQSRYPARTSLKFSHLIKQMTVEFHRDSSLMADNMTGVEWKKKKPTQTHPSQAPVEEEPFNCLSFERKSDENINVTINLVRDEIPERFEYSKPLAQLLDETQGDRAGAVMGVWTYLKYMRLQEDEDTRKVHCDGRMRAVFNVEYLHFPDIPSLLTNHLHPLPPIKLPYTIRTDQAFHSSSEPQHTIYDIPVMLPSAPPIVPSIPGPILAHLSALDDHLTYTVQEISRSKAKHAFFAQFGKDPVSFVKRWTSSQRRDLDVILGDVVPDGGTGEEWRHGGEDSIWGSDSVGSSVGVWLARMQKAHGAVGAH